MILSDAQIKHLEQTAFGKHLETFSSIFSGTWRLKVKYDYETDFAPSLKRSLFKRSLRGEFCLQVVELRDEKSIALRLDPLLRHKLG